MTSVVKFATVNNRQPLSLRNFLLSKNFIQSHAVYIQNGTNIYAIYTSRENIAASVSVVATVYAREREREGEREREREMLFLGFRDRVI